MDAHGLSWVESANDLLCDFPLQNLPYGVFECSDRDHIGVAIGDAILDLHLCAKSGLLATLPVALVQSCLAPDLNELMFLGPEAWSALRIRIRNMLCTEANLKDRDCCSASMLLDRQSAQMKLPVRVGDYTDFYASIHHATNVGKLFRPGLPLLPNYKHLPIGYHGRSSSIVVSGTPIKRPRGQVPDVQNAAEFTATKKLDYEVELGCFIGRGNSLGTSIPLRDAEQHCFGICLVNDWSARDIQSWEYQPLGPFLGKSFATSLSPWVVPLEALAPFRVPAATRSRYDPPLLPYLHSEYDQGHGALQITLEAHISSKTMREAGDRPKLLSRTNSSDLYWTFGQMLAHHTSNGCNLRSGDLLASGTISGETPESLGCLLEITSDGKVSIMLAGGETRAFLEDGDEIIISAYCERAGFRRIGLGRCSGMVQA